MTDSMEEFYKEWLSDLTANNVSSESVLENISELLIKS